MLDTPALLLIVPGAILAFALWWTFVIWLIGRLGTWGRLAALYASEAPLPPHRRSMVHLRMGLSNYKGVVTMAADREALHLDLLFLFKAGHPRLRIPWADIVDEGVHGFFIFKQQQLRVQGHRILMWPSDWQALQSARR